MGDNIESGQVKQLPNEQRKGDTGREILDFSPPPPQPVVQVDEEPPSWMSLWRTHKWRIVVILAVVVTVTAVLGGVVGATV
eukprot:919740-Pyramimonas_sp.AAC.1